MAEGQQVDFHAFSSLSPEVGVHVIIDVIYPDNTTHRFSTSRDGHVAMELKLCDSSVTVEARSYWGDYTKTNTTCDPVPVELAMIPSIQANAVREVLRQVMHGPEVSLNGEAYNYYSTLKTAVDNNNVAAAASAANDLQWSLYVAGETRPSYEYGVFAQSAGFETLLSEGIIPRRPVEVDAAKSMVIDHALDLVVMSDMGWSVLIQAQRELGVEATGAWDAQTFRALREVGGKF